jgi:ubiquinone/menaquinone biosynthesis C-methylase UbiE
MDQTKHDASFAYDQKIASSYEKDRVIEPIWTKEQDFVENFIANISSEERILDIPVGTGRFFPFYAKAGVSVIGLDISENMLAEAAGKLVLFEKKERIHLAVDNITQLKLADASIDISICWRLFHLLPETTLVQAIGELSRVTKKQILIQTFGVKERHYLSTLKQAVKPFTKFLRSKNRGEEKEPWCHIQSYEHDEKVIIQNFRAHDFHLKQKTLLDQYKGIPVNIYLFEKRS